ncbi:MAG: PQQ-binding-like beta-propeller repeat protein, partial [Pseudomonadales bacterium]|nr:PQQ-binding-like beta-propeller repeat protein [Pseudomonadales bacterium]
MTFSVKKAGRPLLLVTLVTWLSGCAIFGGDDGPEPAKLKSFKEEVDIKSIWSRNLGQGAEDHAIRLVPAFSGSRVYGASADGNIVAVDSGTGKLIWEIDVTDFYDEAAKAISFADDIDVITGGVGLGNDMVVVGVTAGDIVAVSANDGSLLWKAKTSSEVLAPPVIARNRVFVQSIDGKVAAYEAETGERDWVYSTTIPSLTLRGTSTPVLGDDFLIAGFSNGRITMLNQEQGLVGVEQRVGVSQGKSDLERLVD